MNPADQERQPEPTGGVQEPDHRFTLANERTFLAWIRTALALILLACWRDRPSVQVSNGRT